MMNGQATALFSTRADAERAVDSLVRAGFKPSDVSVLMSEATRDRALSPDANAEVSAIAPAADHAAQEAPLLTRAKSNTEVKDDVVLGAAAGAAAGGFVGLVSAFAAIVATAAVPGLGLIIVGPLVAGLAGAGVGSAAGGTLGALVSLGVPEKDAHFLSKGVDHGGIVVAVTAAKDARVAAESIFHRFGGETISAAA